MAEEILSLPSSPEITKKDLYNPRRNSTGESNLKKGKEKIVPIYLRASTGSCHDFCKYGKRNVTEEKPWRPVMKRVSGKSNRDKIVLSSELQMGKRLSNESVNVIKQRVTKCPSDTAEVTDLRGNSSNVIKRETTNRTLSEKDHSEKSRSPLGKAKKTLLPVPKTNPSKIEELKFPKGSSSSRRVEVISSARSSLKPRDTDEIAKRTTSLKPKSVGGKVSAVPQKFAGNAKRTTGSKRENAMGMRKKIETSKADSNKVLKNPMRASLSSRASFSNASGKINLRNKAGSSKAVASSKNQKQVETQEAGESNCELEPEKSCSGDEKTLYVIKMETENAVLESDQNKRCVLESECSVESPQSTSFSVPLPELLPSSHDTDDEQEESKYTESSDKSDFTVREAEADDESFSKISQTMEDQNEESQMKNNSFSLNRSKLSHDTDDHLSKCTVTSPDDGSSEGSEISDFALTEGEADESFSENSETMEEKEEDEKSQIKNNSISSNDTKSKNLYFKRGKALDHGVEDNSTPRKLKFRRGRILGEAVTKKLEGRRSFKRRGTDVDAGESKPGSEKVVLRHQDVQGKKDSIVFNNVIEETASKLVETRKSKVKALVGAFETVISLQEKNPSGGTAA